MVSAVLGTGTVWLLAESVNGLLAIPNLIAIAALSPKLFQLLKEYKGDFNVISFNPFVLEWFKKNFCFDIGFKEIDEGVYKELIETLMNKPVEELKELYNNRDIEK